MEILVPYTQEIKTKEHKIFQHKFYKLTNQTNFSLNYSASWFTMPWDKGTLLVSPATHSQQIPGFVPKLYQYSVLMGRGWKPVASIVSHGNRNLPQTGRRSGRLIDDTTLQGVPTRFVNRSYYRPASLLQLLLCFSLSRLINWLVG
jgi:hypothetical protein